MGRYSCPGFNGKQIMKKNKLAIITFTLASLALNGCAIFSNLATPTRNEKNVPPEYNLAQNPPGKILILARANQQTRESQKLSYNIYRAVSAVLTARDVLTPEQIIDYRYYITYKNKNPQAIKSSAIDIAKALNADTVFEINIQDYQLLKLPGTNYYSGQLIANGIIYDVQKGWALWPEDGFGKQVSVGFDVDNNGYEGAIVRLARSSGHCLTRYLYGCKVANFKIFDENVESQW